MPVLAYFFINGIITHEKHRFFASIRNGYEKLLKTTKAWKAKEFFDPNFIPTAGDFFTKNLSS
jgi:hypothetical protein